MAAPVVSGEDESLALKCLEVCQTLTSSGLAFTFTLKVGENFTFTLDTKVKDQAVRPRKKKSPSSLRRDERRRTELRAKATTLPGTRQPDPVIEIVSALTPGEKINPVS